MFSKKESFANDIIRPICMWLGAAFFVMFIASSILFAVTEASTSMMLIKIGVSLILYIILFAVLIMVLSKEIVEKFKPLDTLISGLTDDSIRIYGDTKDLGDFAESIKKAQKKYERLSKELTSTRKDLDDIQNENEKLSSHIDSSIDKAMINASTIDQKNNKLLLFNEKEKNLLSDISSEAVNIKKRKNSLYELSTSLNQNIGDVNRTTEDIKNDYEELNDTFNVLSGMLNESAELLDSIFSELAVLQSSCSQINLYSMNTSLEYARSGGMNLSVSNALDEIKSMSKKLNEKSDEIALLLIRAKNSVKLAVEQAEFATDRSDMSKKSFNDTKVKIDKISDKTEGFLAVLDELLENVGALSGFVYDLNTVHENREKNMNELYAQNNELRNALESMGAPLKK